MTDNDMSDLLSEVSDVSYLSDLDLDPDIEVPQSVDFDLSDGSPFKDDNFKILHYNINSILAEGRIEQITEICKIIKVGVLICTESKLDSNIPNNILTIPGYHEPLRKDRNRHGGGIMVFVRENIPSRMLPTINDLKILKDCLSTLGIH